jgi:hypothetical protein
VAARKVKDSLVDAPLQRGEHLLETEGWLESELQVVFLHRLEDRIDLGKGTVDISEVFYG